MHCTQHKLLLLRTEITANHIPSNAAIAVYVLPISSIVNHSKRIAVCTVADLPIRRIQSNCSDFAEDVIVT